MHGNIIAKGTAHTRGVSPTFDRQNLTVPNGRPYSRPSDWLTMTTLSNGDQKFVGLLAIHNEDEYIAVLAKTSTGTYTVDWGDGTGTTAHTSNTKAEHTYDYSAISNTTDCSRGYRQVLVTITATSGNLTYIDLQQKHSSDRTTSGQTFPWLEIAVNGSYITDIILQGSYRLDWLERVWVGENAITTGWNSKFVGMRGLKEAVINLTSATSCDSMFNTCTGLRNVQLTGASSVTTFGYAFRYCYALESVAITGTTSLTSIYYAFNQCYSLKSVYMPDTAALSTVAYAFRECISMKKAPVMNLTNPADFTQMFSYCYSLREVPSYRLPKATTLSNMFLNCYSLEAIDLQDVGKDGAGCTLSEAFYNCHSLRMARFSGTNKINNLNSAFRACLSMRDGPVFSNSQHVTNWNYMFQDCYALDSVPNYDMSGATSVTGMFTGCFAIQDLPTFSMPSVTGFANTFDYCYALQRIPSFTTGAITGCSYWRDTASLMSVGALDLSGATAAGSMVQMHGGTNQSLRKWRTTGCRVSIDSMGYKPMCKAELETVMDNLGKAYTPGEIWYVSNNNGAPVPVSKTSCGTTSGSVTVTQADTSNLTVGMEVSGTGVTDARAVTFQDSGDTVTRVAHGIPNGQKVSFSSITTTTGISTYTVYYVVNATADTFQVADTAGGTAKTLTTDGSGNLLVYPKIASINTNVSFDLDIPASATGTVTLTAQLLEHSRAKLKGWAVTNA